MKSKNIVLFGIALILFGSSCLAVNEALDIGVVYEVLSVFSPIVGIIVSLLGVIKKD